MKNKILSLAILMSLSITFAVSCGSDVQAPSGELPTWKDGDTWTTRFIQHGAEFTRIDSVGDWPVFEGIDCYIVCTQVTSEATPSMPAMTVVTMVAIDRSTLAPIGSQYFDPIDGITCKITQIASWNYSVQPYPLSIGKTWSATVNATTTISPLAENQSEQNRTTTETYSYIYKVERVESITVPAGTFRCFKIVEYDDNNSILHTQWITDETKGFAVKSIDNLSGATSELMSYSLAE